MVCPAENTWMRYVGGGLATALVSDIEIHLDSCASCRVLFANLAGTSSPDGAAATVRAKPARIDLRRGPDELARGSLVNRYVILGTLGRGGMGVVYKAFDPQLDRPVALKLVAMRDFGSEADTARARLLREAKTLAQLSHPNIVAVHDVGAHESDVFVAMEFVAGRTLRGWLHASPRTPREILAVFRDAGAGLSAAHALGIVHRDFKPENVIVGDDGRVRVLDFGLARASRRAERPSLPSLTRADDEPVTHAGAIMGTPAYMAPEQDRGSETDGRSDQFSFCASLYEALFDARPFGGRDYAELAAHRCAGHIRPMPHTRGVSTRVRRALLRGLAVDPDGRFSSIDALLAELGGRPWKQRTKLAIAALALTSLGAAGWATWVAAHAPPTTDEVCAVSAEEVEQVWTPQRRQAVTAAFAVLDVPAAASRAIAGLDRYAAQWADRRVALCKLAVGGEHGLDRDQRVAARMQCLRGRLTKLDAAITVLTTGLTAQTAARSEAIVNELPPLEACDVTDTTPTVGADTRKRWEPLLKDVIAAKLALNENRLDEAARLASSVLERSRAAAEREPMAAALLLLGQAQSRQGHHAEANATLLEAVRAATDVREEGMVVSAWIEIIRMAFTERRLLATLDGPMFSAEVAGLRLSETNPLRAELASVLGRAHLLRGDRK